MLQLGGALVVASLLISLRRGRELVKTLYLLPAVISTVAIAFLFQRIYSLEPVGLLNQLLQWVGLGGLQRRWLSNVDTVLAAVSIPEGWRFTGLYMLIIYAALLAVPQELEEAARLDGANWWQVFTKIRFPYIRPVWITTTIMATTYALRGFDIPYLLTNGGPGQASELLTTYMYKTAFTQHRLRLREHHLGVHRDRVPRRRRAHHPPAPTEGRRMTTQTAIAPPPPVTTPVEHDRMPQRRRHRLNVHRTLATVVITLIVIVQVYPLAWLFITSLRTEQDFASGNPFALPTEITFDNYARAFETGNLGLNILNSLIVTLGANLLIVLLGMMAAYALQVLGFRFSRVVRAMFLIGIIVPVQIALVPLFIDYSSVNLLDTYQSMIIPLAGFALPMSIYLFSLVLRVHPARDLRGGILDGAGPYRIFGQITFPLSVNTIVTIVLVNSIFIWNDFIFANTFVLSDELKTIPLGLQNYIGAMGNVDWTATFAAVCITITPLLLVFLVLNKAMIYGLESGATKG